MALLQISEPGASPDPHQRRIALRNHDLLPAHDLFNQAREMRLGLESTDGDHGSSFNHPFRLVDLTGLNQQTRSLWRRHSARRTPRNPVRLAPSVSVEAARNEPESRLRVHHRERAERTRAADVGLQRTKPNEPGKAPARHSRWGAKRTRAGDRCASFPCSWTVLSTRSLAGLGWGRPPQAVMCPA